MSMTMAQVATEVATRTAREYLRVSKGRGRTARSITDQHADNVAAESDHGPWSWGEAYKDTGSASKYAKRVRDDFEKLLGDLVSGTFGTPGDVLVLWEISRLARETGRGVALIDACETGGYLIHITSHERTYNPANYQDRHSLISGINDAEKEARLLSARTQRGINSAAKEGRPHGRIPFGYARDYEVIDGRPRAVRQYPDPAEGPLIAELFERVAGWNGRKAETIRAISKDWETRGVWIPEKVQDGEIIESRPYTAQHLRAFLVRPVYAGLRKFRGELLPEWEGMEAVVDRELFDAVQAVLADPARRTYQGGGVRHVLSTTLRCDECGGPMVVGKHAGIEGYECQKRGCARVLKAETDRVIIGDPAAGKPGVILAYLSAPHRFAALTRPADERTDEEQTLNTQLATLKAELAELEEAPAPRTARASLAREQSIEGFEKEIQALESKLSDLTRPNPLADLLPEPGCDVFGWWQALDVHQQRARAAILLTPELLGQVRITKAPNRRTVPVTERLVWVRADETGA
ncbi:recombinase family protein [Streptomyces sp. NPDC005385]|uniref:recombinase family protein n=1 Tax=Streptomyces sp. NPDC005385 TaxID=3157039 RepID=UPI0033BC920A